MRIKQFVMECRRVLKVTRKPTGEEFRTISKAAALGMAVIGLIGFAIHVVRQTLFPPLI